MLSLVIGEIWWNLVKLRFLYNYVCKPVFAIYQWVLSPLISISVELLLYNCVQSENAIARIDASEFSVQISKKKEFSHQWIGMWSISLVAVGANTFEWADQRKLRRDAMTLRSQSIVWRIIGMRMHPFTGHIHATLTTNLKWVEFYIFQASESIMIAVIFYPE